MPPRLAKRLIDLHFTPLAWSNMPREIRHIPVLLEDVLAVLRPSSGQIFCDCTTGLGGHSSAILSRLGPAGRLIGMDFDPRHLEIARPHLLATGNPFELRHGNFAGLPQALSELGIAQVDGILADLGVASPQIDDPVRGFSYRADGPLDMRMDPSRQSTAADLLNRMTERELTDAILSLGDETDAPTIAAGILAFRKIRPLATTQDLVEIVCEARNFTLKRALGAKLHPAARTFQAIRMLVNRELPNLQRLIEYAPTILKPGGRLAIISFHSGEDRLVKKGLKHGRDSGLWDEISDEPITATEQEIRINGRSRSAKLRWATRAAE